MNDKLHDAFKTVVPEAPETTGWVAGARRKRRNKQVAVGGAAAAVTLALAVPLAMNLSVFQPVQYASPTPTPTQATNAAITVAPEPARDGMPGAAACFQEDGFTPITEGVTGPELPTGVTKAYLCGDGLQAFGTSGPMDPLVTNPDRIVEAFLALPAAPATPAEGCGYEASAPYRVILEYGNGEKRVLTGYEEDCADATHGTTKKAGYGFQKTLVGLWEDQRSFALAPSPDAGVQALTCTPAQYSMMPIGLGDVTTGIFCSDLPIIPTQEPVEKVILDDALVAQIADKAVAEAVPGHPEALPGGESGVIVLTNQWGDIFPIHRFGHQYSFRGENEMMVWTPTGELAAQLDAALS